MVFLDFSVLFGLCWHLFYRRWFSYGRLWGISFCMEDSCRICRAATIILYGGLLSIIVTVISVWISDGFFSALIAGVVSFFVWGLVVGVADKLGMLPD